MHDGSGASGARSRSPERVEDRHGTTRSPVAQALDLARREAELSTAEFAHALAFNPRSVRRYLNGERRPARETVVEWERACKVEPGSLIGLYDGAGGDPARPASTGEAARRPGSWSRVVWWTAAAGLLAVIAGLLLLRLDGNAESGAPSPDPKGVTGATVHNFTQTYVGDVWIRLTPADGRAGKDHRVTLQWGGKEQTRALPRLSARSRVLVTGKTGRDGTPLRVTVHPAAKIAFGEGDPPPGATDIKSSWK